MASSSSSSSLPTSSDGHHVYISFRRGDQTNFLTDMISLSLEKRGVHTYRDQNHLIRKQTGTEIEKEVREAILDSTISVVLLSKEYLASSWCLEELVRILNCMEENKGMVVLPIFYDVDPSDIRKLRGDAAQELRKQRVGGPWWRRWKNALEIVGGFCGWDHRNNNRVESLLVGGVVEDIVNKRFPSNRISIYPLAYETCDVYLKQFLQMGMDDVLIVGICGQSRMGKTMIAKAVYKQIFNTFDGSSFLTNVGQYSKQPNGLVQLQEKLLDDILPEINTMVTNVTRGMDMIKEKLRFKRVLIVLDDVDDLEQLFALVGNRSWFGSGSKIIITTRTRNVQLLNLFRVDQVFMAQGLPLPHNIQVIWEQFQQTNRIIVGLREYIESLHNSNNVHVKYLEDSLLRERRKNATQAQLLSDSKEAQSPGSASTACIAQDAMMHGNDGHGRSINPSEEAGLEEIITGRVEAEKAKVISL